MTVIRHLFIVNPVAGGAKAAKDAVITGITSLMEQRNANYEIYITKHALDAVSKIRAEAPLHDSLRVYACGGDGTLNECANGAVGLENVAITHFPCGTGNDFIKMFGADAELFRNLELLIDGDECPLDLIRCGDRYGINICSIGIDARIGLNVHKYSHLPVIGGAAGYIVSLVVNLIKGITDDLTITVDGATQSGKYTLLCACNGRYYGGGFNPIPDAVPNDGLLDFLVVKGVSRLAFIRLVGKYAKGKYRELEKVATYIRTTKLSINCDYELEVNLDGEKICAKSVEFEVNPGGVNFFFPHGTRLFNESPCNPVISEA